MPSHFVRLSVDLDPSGNPIGWHVSAKDHKQDSWQALYVANSGPFADVNESWSDLLEAYVNLGVEQMVLF